MGLCTSAVIAIGLHLNSYHTNTKENYNNDNPGVYFRYDNWIVGTYKNSIRKQTTYVAKSFVSESCRYELVLGAAAGYRIPVMPMLGVGINFDISEVSEKTKLKILIAPSVNKSVNGAVFHAVLEKSF